MTQTATSVESGPRAAIVTAFMGLLAERDYDHVTLADTAARAGVSLAELRGAFASRLAVIDAFLGDIDRAVLEGLDADLAGQDTKERLFDLLMRRLDLLGPHKQAIRTLSAAAMRDPCLALALNGFAVRSQRWMLAGAGIEVPGAGGAVRAQGLALAFANVLRTWLDDEDPALARTMRALDEQLARAGRAAGMLRTVERLTAPLRALACAPFIRGERRRRHDRDREGDEKGWRGDDFRDPKVTPV